MASDKFFTLPADVLADKRLGFIDWRTFAAVSYRDRRSIAKGHSRGCYASQRTLAKDINADYRNVGRSLKKLVELGFLRIEDNEDRAGSNEYRVIESGEFRNPGSGARSDPGPTIDETRDEEFIDPGSGVSSLPKAGSADTPEDYAQFYPQDNFAEADARERACPPNNYDIRQSLQDRLPDAIAWFGTQRALARKLKLSEGQVSHAKGGRSVPPDAADRLLRYCGVAERMLAKGYPDYATCEAQGGFDDEAPPQPDPPEPTQPDLLDAGAEGLGVGEHVAAAPPSPPPSFFAVLPHDWQQLDGPALLPFIEQAFDRIDREPAAIPDAERIELRELLRGYASTANTDRPTRAKAAILTAELSSRERTTHAQH